MSPDAQAIRDFLRRVMRRGRGLRMLRGAAIGVAIAALIVFLAGGRTSLSILLLIGIAVPVAAALAGAAWSPLKPLSAASLVESRTPESRNLVLTSAEMLESRVEASPHLTSRVFRDTARVVAGARLDRVLPARNTVGAFLATLVLLAGAIAARSLTPAVSRSGPAPDEATLRGVSIEISPPEYSGQSAKTLRDPQRIEALAGSRLRVTTAAAATAVHLETLAGTVAMQPDGHGSFSAVIEVDADGYVAIVPSAANGTAGERRLMGLSVTPDRAPAVRVTAPAKDLMVPASPRSLPVVIEADDDLGLASVRLRYTRVSGSGENFTFKEGEVPVEVTRKDDRRWTARADWAIGALQLEPGDMLIYRGVATDRRPGAPTSESDAFIVEIAAAGKVAADGFAIDDREDRYAISQQMVIVKTERLIKRKPAMTPEDVSSETLGIAAEQRQVRAEFVFMMGGELADAGLDMTALNEEAEASGEEDLAAGRLANQGRLDLLRAIRSMSRAAARLADGDSSAALPLEKEALGFLQRAFSRSRYILRTLGARERLDLSRRLTGVLAALGRDAGPAIAPSPNPRVESLRRILADVSSVDPNATDSSARLTSLAQRTLQIDPASEPIRQAAAKISTFGTAVTARRTQDAIRARDEAAAALAALARQELLTGTSQLDSPDLAALSGALADALRAKGGRR